MRNNLNNVTQVVSVVEFEPRQAGSRAFMYSLSIILPSASHMILTT